MEWHMEVVEEGMQTGEGKQELLLMTECVRLVRRNQMLAC